MSSKIPLTTPMPKYVRFGAGLPPPEDTKIDYSRVMNYDRQQGDSRWAAITTTEFVAPGDGSEKVSDVVRVADIVRRYHRLKP